MNLENRKVNLINWISSLQEEDILAQVEKIQKDKADWWDAVSSEDKKLINEGLNQLDRGEYFTRDQVRSKIRKKYSL